ncbi:hypothetical protein EDD86DRAFT_58652 [Gorgonomyces haynaldii]|nr:hypothetical protein EDD86DRAFT_58652 [Gorgonomyces haynaldii]
MICKFYQSKGCRNGDQCPYEHIKPKFVLQLSNGKSKGIGQSLEDRVSHISIQSKSDTPTTVPQEQPTKKQSTPETVQQTVERRDEKPVEGTDEKPVEKTMEKKKFTPRPAFIPQLIFGREQQISQLERRFKQSWSHRQTEEGDTVEFKLKPSDPDFPFDLEHLECLLQIPKEYPDKRPCPLLILNPEIPDNLKDNISRGWLSGLISTKHSLLENINYMDRQLEQWLIAKEHVKIQLIPQGQQELHFTQESEEILDEQSEENEEESEEETVVEKPQKERQWMTSAHRGTEIKLVGLNLDGISFINVNALSVTVRCLRCKTLNDIEKMIPNDQPKSLGCKTCSTLLSSGYRDGFLHQTSRNMGYLDLVGANAFDILPSDYTITCEHCSFEQENQVFRNFGHGKQSTNCLGCHKPITTQVDTVRFVLIGQAAQTTARVMQKKPKEDTSFKSEILKTQGVCQHYKNSHRWFRFPCCGKLYPCDVCHDNLSDGHEMKLATRMVCGFCAKEQAFSSKPCTGCGKILTGQPRSGFWQGGKGTRDQQLMSRNDSRKYRGMTKTVSNRKRNE